MSENWVFGFKLYTLTLKNNCTISLFLIDYSKLIVYHYRLVGYWSISLYLQWLTCNEIVAFECALLCQ